MAPMIALPLRLVSHMGAALVPLLQLPAPINYSSLLADLSCICTFSHCIVPPTLTRISWSESPEENFKELVRSTLSGTTAQTEEELRKTKKKGRWIAVARTFNRSKVGCEGAQADVVVTLLVGFSRFSGVARMGVKPMSPSANFTTYNLPPSRNNDGKDDAFGHHAYALPRPKGSNNNGSSLFRFLLCSRPCFQQQSVDIQQHDDEATVDLEEENLDHDEDLNARVELQSVMRHLEVRWQLFDEALSRFGDLEAMLAICSDKVRWRHYTADSVKESHIAEDLKSLISRKLSMEVSINRITKLSSSGELGTSFDRDEDEGGQLQSGNDDGVQVQVQAALDLFHETRRDMGNDWLRNSRLCVLEQDTYIFCNQKGQVVEEGMQLVIWEQYNATWYIRGCVSYPSTTENQLIA